MNTIHDDCKMDAAEELHDILAEADNAIYTKVCSGAIEQALAQILNATLATQPTPPTAEATEATADE
jgi:hypothetical protein